MKVYLHQTHLTIADFHRTFSYLEQQVNSKKPGIHLYPELFLTGYPLQDLCLQKPFIQNYHQLLQQIDNYSLALPPNDEAHLFGGLAYQLNHHEFPQRIENVIYLLIPGQKIRPVYCKQLLPNYDIFDEKKYFTPGKQTVVIELLGHNFALMICEDMWPSDRYDHNPVHDLFLHVKAAGQKLDGVINLSASPFHLGKMEKRLQRGMEISQILQAPFIYVNRVGAEDEIIFDGGSFVVHGKSVLDLAKRFCDDELVVPLPTHRLSLPPDDLATIDSNKTSNTWEDLFTPQIVINNTFPPQLISWNWEQMQEAISAIILGIQDYAQKCQMNKFLVALSGGIDSALVTVLAKLALRPGQQLEALYMPGIYSASISYDLSKELCDNLKIKLQVLPIKFLHTTCRHQIFENLADRLHGLADENIQSRLRGTLLYARANQTNAMVLNTSNKSELAVGYSTLYGDSVGALGVLGDLYKTEVYWLANFINKQFGPVIPELIIQRPPSAELRDQQEDAQSLPPYDRLDVMLEGIISNQVTAQDLMNWQFDPGEVKRVFDLFQKSEFKRFQFCPIIKIKSKSFGFGHRVPICRHFHQ